MASHAAPQPEDLTAGIQLVGHLGDDLLGVTLLASGFQIFLGVQRPQPVFVVAMRLLDAGQGHAIAAVARRAAELLRIVHF